MEIKISITQPIFNEGPPCLGHNARPSGYSGEQHHLSSPKMQSLGDQGGWVEKPIGNTMQQKL